MKHGLVLQCELAMDDFSSFGFIAIIEFRNRLPCVRDYNTQGDIKYTLTADHLSALVIARISEHDALSENIKCCRSPLGVAEMRQSVRHIAKMLKGHPVNDPKLTKHAKRYNIPEGINAAVR